MTELAYTVPSDGMTLAQVIWVVIGRQPRGYLEIVMDHNQDIERDGVYLPAGTIVMLPVSAIPDDTQRLDVIRLWD